MSNLIIMAGIPVAAILLIIIAAGIVYAYVKAPPSTALIISGLKRTPRILIGQGGVRIPFLERMDTLFLGQISVDIKTETSVPTNDYINVNVDAVAKVMVGRDEESVQLAARNFLNFTAAEIAKDLQDSLEGNMREIIGTLTLEAINTDRDSFSDQVVIKAAQDMKKLGIEIISCNIQNVTDDNGLIVDLGADNTARIKKRAAISRAEAERDVAVAKAQAQKEANDAQVQANLEIAQRNTDLAIRQAELKKASDIKRAEADAAYEIQAQEQQKSIQTATVNAQIAKAERDQELRKNSPRRFKNKPTPTSPSASAKPKPPSTNRSAPPKRRKPALPQPATPQSRKLPESRQRGKPKPQRSRQKVKLKPPPWIAKLKPSRNTAKPPWRRWSSRSSRKSPPKLQNPWSASATSPSSAAGAARARWDPSPTTYPSSWQRLSKQSRRPRASTSPKSCAAKPTTPRSPRTSTSRASMRGRRRLPSSRIRSKSRRDAVFSRISVSLRKILRS